jgi:hypothetical protein
MPYMSFLSFFMEFLPFWGFPRKNSRVASFFAVATCSTVVYVLIVACSFLSLMCLLLLESLLFLTSLLFSPPCWRSCCFWLHVVFDILAVSDGLMLLMSRCCWRPAVASIPAVAGVLAVPVVFMYAKVTDDRTFVLLQLDRYLFCLIVLSKYRNRIGDRENVGQSN